MQLCNQSVLGRYWASIGPLQIQIQYLLGKQIITQGWICWIQLHNLILHIIYIKLGVIFAAIRNTRYHPLWYHTPMPSCSMVVDPKTTERETSAIDHLDQNKPFRSVVGIVCPLRKPHPPFRINGERGFLRVNRLYGFWHSSWLMYPRCLNPHTHTPHDVYPQPST